MIALLASLALAHDTPDRVEAWRSAIDWSRAGDESARWLADYLKVDTVAPPGNEMDGVRYLQSILDAEGIASEVVDHGDNRGSLIARLAGDGSKPPLCLLSHIDVVPSERDRWTFDPLSGAIEDGVIYGRGALDMKGMGIVELAAMVHLKRLGVPLERDVLLVAVADEEVDGMGMQELVKDHWDRIGCSHMINEGGLGIRDALFEGQDLHAISVAEKGTLWVKMIAEGTAGHGSTIEPDEAPGRLLEAMALVERKYHPKPRIDPALRVLFRQVGRQKGGFVGAVLRSRVLFGLLVKPKLLADPQTSAALTDTVHLTGMGGASSTNVIPSEVWAQYDCRLLPGTEPGALLGELEHITRKLPWIRWEAYQQQPANGSPWDDPFYERIEHYAAEGRPQAAAGPVLSVGFTDSIFARPLGVNAYGYVPFVITRDEGATMHGHDERLSVENVQEGTRRMFSIVLDFAGADAAPDAATLESLAAWRAVPATEKPDGLGAELVARGVEGVPGRYTRGRLEAWMRAGPLPTPEQLGEDGLAAVIALGRAGGPGFLARVVEPWGCEAGIADLAGLRAEASLEACSTVPETPESAE